MYDRGTMNDENSESLGSARDSLFLTRVFRLYAKRAEDSLFGAFFVEESEVLDESKLQEAVAVRNIVLSRELASSLIDEDGALRSGEVKRALGECGATLHQLGPERHLESKRRVHILLCLEQLEDAAIRNALKRIHRPYKNPTADRLIRDTLHLASDTKLTDAHARRAALSAWFCLLRQNVGSCFATAPAIMIQQEQPLNFFRDLDELLSTGRLNRTFGGVEHVVPLSPSWGVGELRRPMRVEEGASLWEAPGLKAALDAVGLQPKRLEMRQQQISIEELIEMLLMEENDLTPQDLAECENRGRGRLDASFMGGVVGKEATVDKACARFREQKEAACRAFNLLTENPLLKSWEFTLASFAESGHDFCRWNLYASLGMGSEDAGGIGHKLYHLLKDKVDRLNEEAQEHQVAYEPLYDHVKYLETRVRTASTEEELKYLRMELRSRVAEMDHVLRLRDEAAYKGKLFAQLYTFLLGEYDAYFRDYFQEVYDPDVHEVTVGPYDDSPAGFRLLYKHGRTQTNLWTLIRSADEYVDALVSFFIATEPEIAGAEGLERVGDEVRAIVSQLVSHVKTREFLESAFHRMAIAHKVRPLENPLENLDKVQKKPWVYTSGGTMDTLVAAYYKREQKPSCSERWVEEPAELLAFLLETAKGLSPRMQAALERDPNRSVLIHSPTHAFLFKPGWHPFKKGWESSVYPYTYVRDQWVVPRKRELDEMRLDREAQETLIPLIAKELSGKEREAFLDGTESKGSMSPMEFRDSLLEAAGQMPPYLSDLIDQTLYHHLPCTPHSEVRRHIRELFDALGFEGEKMAVRFEALDGSPTYPAMPAGQLVELCKALLVVELGSVAHEIDWEERILSALRAKRLKLSEPIVFADSNWMRHHFAFVVNPGTQDLEFWRVEEKGERGTPMSIWEQWLNGTRKKPSWGVSQCPFEYGQLDG